MIKRLVGILTRVQRVFFKALSCSFLSSLICSQAVFFPRQEPISNQVGVGTMTVQPEKDLFWATSLHGKVRNMFAVAELAFRFQTLATLGYQSATNMPVWMKCWRMGSNYKLLFAKKHLRKTKKKFVRTSLGRFFFL